MYRFASLAAGAIAAVSVLASTFPAAEAQPVASHANQCFRLSQVMNSRMVGFRTLYMRTSARTYYRVDFGADCNNAGTEPLVIHPVSNDDWICGASSVDISVARTHQGCIPTDVVLLTPDQVDAIPARDRP